MIAPEKPRSRTTQHPPVHFAVSRGTRPVRRPVPRRVRLRRERSMVAAMGVAACFLTLALLYIAAHASVTGDGYQRAALKQQLAETHANTIRLRAQIAAFQDSNRIATEAARMHLIRDTRTTRFLTTTPERP